MLGKKVMAMNRRTPSTFCILTAVLASTTLVQANERVPSRFNGAENVRPFVTGSLASLVAAHANKPFVLAFWSVTCAHCPSELKVLGELKRQYPKLDVVLIATDSPDDAADSARMAGEYGLGRTEQWVFADERPERLRFEIDQRWLGELPRTYFYDRQHKLESVSGVVPRQILAAWIKKNLP